jgi:predicted methyltransferase
MPTVLSSRRALFYAALLGVAGVSFPPVHAAEDLYDGAVHHAGRAPADLKRDAIDHPAEVLRLAGIKPGMRVADILAADGYYSELLSYVVGPGGHVLMLNNATYDHWSPGLSARLAGGRLPNVEHRTVDLEKLDLPSASVDALVVIKVYHDLYWVDAEQSWPKLNPSAVLAEMSRVLKPGGVLLLEDHSAREGTGSSAAQNLHRIEESYARRDFESHGLRYVGSSDVLRRSDDARDQITYKGPMVGKTDRFVLLFRKQP